MRDKNGGKPAPISYFFSRLLNSCLVLLFSGSSFSDLLEFLMASFLRMAAQADFTIEHPLSTFLSMTLPTCCANQYTHGGQDMMMSMMYIDRIQTFLFNEVDMGNIYFCSDLYIICSRMDI